MFPLTDLLGRVNESSNNPRNERNLLNLLRFPEKMNFFFNVSWINFEIRQLPWPLRFRKVDLVDRVGWSRKKTTGWGCSRFSTPFAVLLYYIVLRLFSLTQFWNTISFKVLFRHDRLPPAAACTCEIALLRVERGAWYYLEVYWPKTLSTWAG